MYSSATLTINTGTQVLTQYYDSNGNWRQGGYIEGMRIRAGALNSNPYIFMEGLITNIDAVTTSMTFLSDYYQGEPGVDSASNWFISPTGERGPAYGYRLNAVNSPINLSTIANTQVEVTVDDIRDNYAFVGGQRVRLIAQGRPNLSYFEGTLQAITGTTWSIIIEEVYLNPAEPSSTLNTWTCAIAGSRATNTASELLILSEVNSTGTFSGALIVRGGVGIHKNTYIGSLQGSGTRAVYSTQQGLLTNTASDENLKTNITSLDQGLSAVLALNPVSYTWKDTATFGTQTEIGFLAQQVQKIVPEVVGQNADGSLSLDYPKLTAVLVKSIHELEARVAALEARL